VAKDNEREFRLWPRKPPVSSARSESTAWPVAFKAVIHHSRMSRRKAIGNSSATFKGRRSFQRCAVRVTYSRNAVKGQWRAHGRYVARDSATMDGQLDAAGFNDHADTLDMTTLLDSWQRAGDERMWKLIISPEFGERVDLRKLTRELMAGISHDLGTDLEWTAATHHNTEHPHAHVALRGVDASGVPLRIDRDYIKHGIRQIAEDLCTRQLGYRTEQDSAVASAREVSGGSWHCLGRVFLPSPQF
jgi:type IV secretory pathway VirD2 relaxase